MLYVIYTFMLQHNVDVLEYIILQHIRQHTNSFRATNIHYRIYYNRLDMTNNY